ncbi:hypothetical protein HNR44_001621 [Geomicrobium halophilum]|uniref:DUF1722 domain-containing protein n=1 Tax=Geomicrobium halophilum TaxID=549000 RepID=A0A841PYD2_9BACL|nr:DUF1722 domain-containing protein [Geomicrobium halophilum]MBB6449643.1 hypothetical protein [Geomicrobium halophilum]
MNPIPLSRSKKTIQKASESVWAANKYFVLACSQKQYQSIREDFRPDQRHLLSAYQQIQETENTYQTVTSGDLPELSNALYHLLGYFKQELSQEHRQMLNEEIKKEPQKVLRELETLTFEYRKSYLMPCRLWQRDKAFNEVPVAMKIEGQHFEPYTLHWCGDYIIQKG